MQAPSNLRIKALYLPEWGVTLRIIIDDFGAHCVVYEVCGVLGVASAKDQVKRIKRRKAIAPYLRKFVLPTSRGNKETNCLHIHALAFWLALIDPERVRPEFETGMVEFQVTVLERLAPLLEGDSHDESKIIYLAEHLGKSRDIRMLEDENEDDEDQEDEDDE